MTTQSHACCSSPAAMGDWCSISVLAWGVLGFIGIYWRPLHASSATTVCLAVAIGCVANWFRNRTLHCAITGPLFLLAGIAFLLSDIRTIDVNSRLVWPIVAIVTGIAFLVEWRYAARP